MQTRKMGYSTSQLQEIYKVQNVINSQKDSIKTWRPKCCTLAHHSRLGAEIFMARSGSANQLLAFDRRDLIELNARER